MDLSLAPSLEGQASYEADRRQIERMDAVQLRQQLAVAAQAVMVDQPAALRFMAAEAARWMTESRRLRLELIQQRAAAEWDESELVG